jgi:hypothetical protein
MLSECGNCIPLLSFEIQHCFVVVLVAHTFQSTLGTTTIIAEPTITSHEFADDFDSQPTMLFVPADLAINSSNLVSRSSKYAMVPMMLRTAMSPSVGGSTTDLESLANIMPYRSHL